MKYIKFVCSNGYAGCDKEFFYAFNDSPTDAELQEVLEDCLNEYAFSEPDNRFCDCDNEAEVKDYYDEVESDSYWEEVSKEEWKENEGEEY